MFFSKNFNFSNCNIVSNLSLGGGGKKKQVKILLYRENSIF